MATIAEALEAARRYHQAGALQQAEQLYRQILQAAPGHADALHLLGVLAYQVGNYTAAVDYVRAALASSPVDGRIHATLGLVYQALQRFEEAQACLRQCVQLLPFSPDAHFNLAKALQSQGRLEEAAASYQHALRLKPDFAEAHNNLGNVLQEQAKFADAVVHYQQTLRLNPGHVDAYNNLGNALKELGHADEATACFQKALHLQPNSDQAYNNLGNISQEQGNFERAAAFYQEALRCNPKLVSAHLNLGNVLRAQRELPEAIASYRRAVELEPLYADGYLSLGIGLHENGDLDQAKAAYRQALDLKPQCVDACNRLGILLQSDGRLDEALVLFRQALRYDPDYVEALNNLGNILCKQSKRSEADACYRQALRLKPDCAETYNNLGSLFTDQGNLEEAALCYQQALRLKPDLIDASAALSSVLHDQGKVDDAMATLQQALQLQPSTRLQIMLATCLPVIHQSVAELQRWRDRLVGEIHGLLDRHVVLDLTDELARPLFYLVYQGFNDRDIQREVARLYTAPQPALGTHTEGTKDRGDKIRVGFISSFFKRHTIGHWMRGLVAKLSRDDFTVVVLSVGSHQDEIAHFFKEHADRYLEVPRHLQAARRLIADQQLDVLFYADIGMDPGPFTLAFSRLAPVQCVTLGHPVTSGIDTIDYYISAEALETEEADQYYTETLIRLKTLPVYFYRPELPSPLKERDHFGLAKEDHVFTCLQSLFKFHPAFDDILGGILRGDPRGLLLLSKGKVPHVEQLLRKRFAATLPDVAARIRFQPVLGYGDYLNLLAVSDVQLDPTPFGGGCTSYDGLSVGIPIVTMPTRLQRGRITYTLYKQMDVLDCVADNAQNYIDIALRLGTDNEYRQAIRKKIIAGQGVLFENSDGVRELEQFFRRVVHQAAAGNSKEGQRVS